MLLPLRLNLEPHPSTPGIVKGGGIVGIGGLKAYVKKEETEEEKQLRREAQGIIKRIKESDKDQGVSLFADSANISYKLQQEVNKLEIKALEFNAERKYSDGIRAQRVAHQMKAQIEEIDAAFVMFTMLAHLD